MGGAIRFAGGRYRSVNDEAHGPLAKSRERHASEP